MGGGLIAASFLVAIVLNRSAHEEVPAAQPVQPSARVCADLAQRGPAATHARESGEEKCAPAAGDSAPR